MLLRRLAAPAALAAAAVSLDGSTQTPTTPPAVELTPIRVLASGPGGAPVADLRAEELTVRVNGRARPVRSVQFVRVAPAAGGAPAFDGPPPFGTNSPDEDGRSVLVLVDDESIAPGDERRLVESLSTFVDGLSPRDSMAIFSVPHGGVRTDFTTDHGALRQALSQIVGRAQRQSALIDMSCQSKQTLEAIRAAVTGVRHGGGVPMVLVLSGGLVGQRRELERIGSAAQAPNACDVRFEDFQMVARATAEAEALFWVARSEWSRQPAAPVEDAAGRSSNVLVGLEQLAGAARAPLYNLTGSDGTVLRRVLVESSGYLLVRFEADASDRTGQPRALEVRTSRSGVAVRSVPEITWPDATRTVKARPATPEDLLKVTAVHRDLPLRVVAYVAREREGVLRLSVMGEAADASTALTAAAIGLVDSGNRLVGQWSAGPADLSGRVAAAFSGPPGAYRARIAARDQMGRLGTADIAIDGTLAAAGAMRLSGLMLGVARESGFVPRTLFSKEPVVSALLELYGASAGANVQAAFELSGSLNGPAIIRQAATFTATNEPDKFLATAALPIGALAPGDYVVRAVFGLEGQPVTRVVRTLRKTAGQ